MDPIRRGDAGPAVADVQDRLRAVGTPPDGDAPGRYGAATEGAVRRFQQRRHLVADGVVGTDTWAALVDAGFRLGDRLLYDTRPPLRGDDVLELQQRLGRLGFDSGPPDGILRPSTAAAVREFQHNCGVTVDGIVGPAVIALLDTLHRDHQSSMGFEVVDRVRPPDHVQPAGARLLLDPDLGPAAAGPERDGVRAAELVWDIASRAAGQLLALGAVPLLTRGRTTTPTTEQRVAFANEADVRAIVTLRCAALEQPTARGVAAYHFGSDRGTSQQGRRLAEHLVAALSQALDTPNCRTHASTTRLLRESRPPAVILEVGYLSNPDEGAALLVPAYRQRLAAAVVDGVLAWLEGRSVPTAPGAPATADDRLAAASAHAT